MWLLGLQVAAIAVAPVLDRATRRATPGLASLHRWMRWIAIAVVLGHVLPEGWVEVGSLAIAAAVAGFGLAWAAERATGSHQGLAAMGAAMALHHLFDGF